eukprot:COSAG01_NODE_1540_length_9985_cov_7.634855_6_plen_176_part_01
MLVKPQSFGNGLRTVAAFRVATSAGTASEESSGSMGQEALLPWVTSTSSSTGKIVPTRLSRTGRPQAGGAPCRRSPQCAVHCRSPTSLVTPSKGCACWALGGAPNRHMMVLTPPARGGFSHTVAAGSSLMLLVARPGRRRGRRRAWCAKIVVVALAAAAGGRAAGGGRAGRRYYRS